MDGRGAFTVVLVSCEAEVFCSRLDSEEVAVRRAMTVCAGLLVFSGCSPEPAEQVAASADVAGLDTVSADAGSVDVAGLDTVSADAGSVDTSAPDTEDLDSGGADTSSPPGACEAQGVAKALSTKLESVDGSEFIYKTPPGAKGLVLMFHGGGGSKEDNLHLRVEPVLIAREALERGYSVVSLDSVAHVVPNGKNNYQWNEDDTAENPDVANAIAMVSRLNDPQDLNVAPADGPVLLIGISNGGSMASRVAQHMDAAAVAIFVSNAVAFGEAGATIPPLMLCPGQNDPGYALGSNEDLADDITAAGGLVIFSPNEPGPVTPGLFTRVEGIDCALSKAIGQSLNDAGWLNTDDTLANDPKEDKSWQEALPETADLYEDQLSDVLVEAYAGHTPSSDKNDLVFDFFDEHDD